ncbi:MAG: DUF4126 domain-containing protein [Cyanobacteriota bacterium]
MTIALDNTWIPPILLEDLLGLFLGIALSAACGLRVFVPFLVISAVGVLGGWTLPPSLAWLDTEPALALFAAASVLEIGAYSIPWLDNLLDAAATPLAIAAGVLVTAALIPEDMGPLAQWTVAAIAGGGSAGIIKSLSSLTRLASTATTGGLANPLWTTLETLGAAVLASFALALPILAGALTLGLLSYGLVRLIVFFRRRRPSQTPS